MSQAEEAFKREILTEVQGLLDAFKREILTEVQDLLDDFMRDLQHSIPLEQHTADVSVTPTVIQSSVADEESAWRSHLLQGTPLTRSAASTPTPSQSRPLVQRPHRQLLEDDEPLYTRTTGNGQLLDDTDNVEVVPGEVGSRQLVRLVQRPEERPLERGKNFW